MRNQEATNFERIASGISIGTILGSICGAFIFGISIAIFQLSDGEDFSTVLEDTLHFGLLIGGLCGFFLGAFGSIIGTVIGLTVNGTKGGNIGGKRGGVVVTAVGMMFLTFFYIMMAITD